MNRAHLAPVSCLLILSLASACLPQQPSPRQLEYVGQRRLEVSRHDAKPTGVG